MNNYLRERGVLETTFLACGGEFGDPRDTATIATRLNRDPAKVGRDHNWAAVEEILWFPLYGPQHDLIQWLARPLPKYGESKFVAPSGSNGSLWIPPETYAVAKHVSVPLVITEGPCNGMVLKQAGAHPIAPVGVWTVTIKGDNENDGEPDEGTDQPAPRIKLHSIFERFQLANRKVFMAFDADRVENPHVRHAEIRAWMMLFKSGADVYQLSTWDLKDGKGLDDFLAAKAGTDSAKQREVYLQLFEKAVPFIDTLGDSDIKTVTAELHRTQDDRVQFELLRTKLAKHFRIPKDSFGHFQSGEDDAITVAVRTIAPTAQPWDAPVNAKEVLDAICTTIHRFVSLKDSQCRAVALWVVLTYLHDAVDILPLLLITSPEEACGKTSLLKVVFYLANRPVPAGNISAAAIYRTIKDIAPTMALDEADTYLKENEEMRGVIDSGHEREFAWVIRTAMEGEDTVYFSTWCPKALAMIGLPRRTILSRSIHIRLDRKASGVKTEKLKKKHYGEFEELRKKISRLANDIREQVRVFESDLLENRAGDNWQPLAAVANSAGNDWVIETAKAAEHINSKDVQDSKSTGRYLLESIAQIIKERCGEKKEAAQEAAQRGAEPTQGELGDAAPPKKERIPTPKMFLPTTEGLLPKLNDDDEAPWREDRKGARSELTARKLAALLKLYGVESDQVRYPDGLKTSPPTRGYWIEDLEKAIEKYAHS